MKFVLEDENLKSYARTDDAIKAFTAAVSNGQARLAMEILVPIIEQMADSLGDAEDIDSIPTPVEPKTVKKASKQTVSKAPESKQEEEPKES